MSIPQYPERIGPPSPEFEPMAQLFETAKRRVQEAISSDQWRYEVGPIFEGEDVLSAPAYLFVELSSDYDRTRNGEPGTIIHIFLPHTENTTEPEVEPLNGRYWFLKGVSVSEEGKREEILKIKDTIEVLDLAGEPKADKQSFLCGPSEGEAILSSESYLEERLAFYKVVPINA